MRLIINLIMEEWLKKLKKYLLLYNLLEARELLSLSLSESLFQLLEFSIKVMLEESLPYPFNPLLEGFSLLLSANKLLQLFQV